jgi:hypothetical protein
MLLSTDTNIVERRNDPERYDGTGDEDDIDFVLIDGCDNYNSYKRGSSSSTANGCDYE